MAAKRKLSAPAMPGLRKRAEELLAKTGSDVARMSPADVQALVHELQVHQIELELQNDELRRTQAELERSREKFFELFEFAPVGYLTLDEEGRILEANLTASTMLATPRSQVSGKHLRTFVAPQGQDAYYRHHRAVFGAQGKWLCELPMQRGDGQPLSVLLESIGFDDGETPRRRCRTALIDITARLRAEDELRALNAELEKRVARRTAELERRELEFRTLATNVPAIFAFIDERERYVFVNRRFEELFGRPAEEIIGRTVREIVGPERYALAQPCIARVLAGEQVAYEADFPFPDGARTLAIVDVPEFDEQGRVKGFFMLANDLTERRALEREVLEIAAREQQRIGQDLHDEAGQELTGLGLLAHSLVEALAERAPEQAPMAVRIAEGLKSVTGHLRGVIRGLVPVNIGGDGLTAALEQLTSQTADLSGLRCTFDCPNPVELNDYFVASHLYRIAQEALGNAIKHSGASGIRVLLEARNGTLRLSVTDDGRGLPADRGETGGLGLRLMQYRADMIGARLEIAPAKPRGTAVTCTLTRAAADG